MSVSPDKPGYCPDCRTERPATRVGCPGCLAHLIREQPREDWDMALSGIMRAHGHRIAFQTRRRLDLP
jgi:hypothetical protein